MIELDQLSKTYTQKDGTQVKAVDAVSLKVAEGEICVFLGPSGCGKTTTLKMINRLINPTSGRVMLNGQDTSGIDEVELRRHIGYVIQQIGLFPNMTIEENITIVPRLLGWDKKRCHERATELMAMVALDPKKFLKRYPRELSGGQQQRIGVIRALAADAPVLLMDEPFGALDALTRGVVQDELLKICAATGQTVFMITHDVDEAILLADKIFLMSNGPQACIAEVVINTLPKTRSREAMHHDPQFYRIRNHLVDFLVHRSRQIQAAQASGVPRPPTRIVMPGLEQAVA